MKKSIVALSVLAASSSAFAADYSDGDIHKNDYKWSQFNLMYAFNELPGSEGSNHDYLEMEFGGRSGIVDLYGFVDVFNLTTDSDSDKADADSKVFIKAVPRISLDALTGKDLSLGPVQEVYVAAELTWDGATGGVNNQKVGLGSDVMVPWLGKVGVNLYSTYSSNDKDWNGFQISTNWFKPFHFFENGSFISYQGYIDYQFGMKDEYSTASNGGVMYNGIYWHSDRFAVGYGLKGFKDVYGLEDGVWGLETTGFGHYVAATYKF